MQAIPIQQVAGGEIMVNGRTVTEEAIDQEVQYHPAPSLEEARKEAARALSIRTMLITEAERQGITGEDRQTAETQEEAQIRMLLDQELDNPEPDDAACRQYFDSNRERFRSPSRYHVSHIFRPAPADNAEARVAARERCRRIIRVCQADSSRFTRLAFKHSKCPSAEAGGDMGVVGPGDTAHDFEKALDRLPEGEISTHPLETRYGFHVVWLHERQRGELLPYEAVKEKIATYLKESVWRRSVSQYLQILAGRSRIEGIDLGGADNPLVQ